MRRSTTLVPILAALAPTLIPVLNPAHADAQITRLVITERDSPTFEGHVFGEVGPYEWLIGHADGELDPADPRNAGIVNLDRAPRNERGRVEYTVDVQILIVGSNEDRVYETVFVFPRGPESNLDAAYREITASLRELTEREAATYRPRRIKVIEARPGDTQEGLARRMAVGKRPLELFRVLNGLEPRDRIVAGRPLKLVVE